MDALNHKWFQNKADEQVEAEQIEAGVIDRLKKYKGKSAVRKNAMRLLVKMSSSSDNQIVHLRRQFQAIDTDNTGLINAEKLIKAMKE